MKPVVEEEIPEPEEKTRKQRRKGEETKDPINRKEIHGFIH